MKSNEIVSQLAYYFLNGWTHGGHTLTRGRGGVLGKSHSGGVRGACVSYIRRIASGTRAVHATGYWALRRAGCYSWTIRYSTLPAGFCISNDKIVNKLWLKRFPNLRRHFEMDNT